MERAKEGKRWALVVVNALTALRFLLALLFVFLLLGDHRSFGEFLGLFALIGASDFWDGRLARSWGVQTKLGSVLDVAADFFFIFSSSAALYWHGKLPIWMLAVLVLKMLEFTVTSRILKARARGRCAFVFDRVGRMLATLFYLMPIFVIAMQRWHGGLGVLRAALYLMTGMALLSSTHRIMLCFRCRRVRCVAFPLRMSHNGDTNN
ncbi:MAG: CDP-alcohol phosphatidyltransferase family protein [Bacillota bacterium]|nr:CDP-alcohol phosphatidyltransferase family protein [Bacillota bacterium]